MATWFVSLPQKWAEGYSYCFSPMRDSSKLQMGAQQHLSKNTSVPFDLQIISRRRFVLRKLSPLILAQKKTKNGYKVSIFWSGS